MKRALKIVLPIVVIALAAGGILLMRSLPTTQYYQPIKEITTNVSGSAAYVKFAPILEINKRGQDNFLQKHAARIVDVILFTVRSKTEEELRAPGANEALSAEIITQLYNELGIDYIAGVYFSGFVIA